MPEFSYSAINAQGAKVTGKVVAENQSEFYDILKKRGEFCTDFTQKGGAAGAEKKSILSMDVGGNSFPLKELASFTRKLATMLRAGITIVDSLDIISNEMENKKLQGIIRTIYEKVQQGTGLADAMQSMDGAFPDFTIYMVKTGEMSGSLDSICEKLADYYEKDIKTRNKAIQAMIYPIILLVVTVLVVIILLAFVMPQMLQTFIDSGTELPGPTKLLMSISDFVVQKWYVLVIVALLIAGFLVFAMHNEGMRLKIDELLLRIPVAGKLYQTIVCSRFCRSLYALFSGGLSLLTSLEMCSKVVGNSYVAMKVLEARDEVNKGKSMSQALSETEVFPKTMMSMFSVGETSGSLDKMIANTAENMEEESDAAITRLVSLLEPVMLIIMAVVVGFIAVSVIMPMYGSYDLVAAAA